MRYPKEDEIVDPSTRLPPEVAAELERYVLKARKTYSRFRQRFRVDASIWQEEPKILAEHAAEVFKGLVARVLQNRPADFETFRRRIGYEGGAAEIAVWYAHYLYKDVQRGRMPFEWQWKTVEPRLNELMKDAEDRWHIPEIVPHGWEDFLSSDGEPSIEAVSARSPTTQAADSGPDVEKRACERSAFVDRILHEKGWSRFELANEAEVDHKTVANYLQGAKSFANTRLKLAKALGVPIEKLPK